MISIAPDATRRLRATMIAGVALVSATLSASARSSKPPVPPGGFPLTSIVDQSVTYTDGYQTLGNLTYPSGPTPPGRWPLVMLVHGLGGSRNTVDAARISKQGYAVWAYDVRGQGDAIQLNDPFTSTSWAWYGPNEKYDLAEQILHVRAQFGTIVSQKSVAVAGPSQGGAHAWFAAAHSERDLTVTGRGTIGFPRIEAALPGLMVADVADTQVRDGMILSYLMVRTAAQPAPFVVKDPNTEAEILKYAAADDGPGLAALWAADPSRNWGHLLDTTTVPIAFFHPWHDGIGPPQPAYDRLATLDGPWRAHLSTGGHLTTFNDFEQLFYTLSDIRWLDRYLWKVQNGMDAEARISLAAMPIDPNQVTDPTFAWGHRKDHDLDPQDAPPWTLYLGDGTLDPIPPATPGTSTITHAVEPGFTPAAWIADPSTHDLDDLLPKMPLSDVTFDSAPLAEEIELGGQVRAHLSVIPQEPRFQVTALLTVVPPGATEDFMLAAWGHEVRDATPGQPTTIDIKIGGVSAVLPAGSVIRLRLRNLWVVEPPMVRDIQGWPSFDPFTVDIEHGGTTLSSLELPRRNLVRPSLNPAISSTSISAPTLIQRELRGGAARANQPYVVFLSASGHGPGVSVDGGTLALKWDVLSTIVSSLLGFPLFSTFSGNLDASGNAAVNLSLAPWSLDETLVGKRITMAAWVMGDVPGVTNPSDVFFDP